MKHQAQNLFDKPGKNGCDAGFVPPPRVGMPRFEGRESWEDGIRREVESDPPITAIELGPASGCL